MDNPIVPYIKQDIFELTEAAGHISRVLAQLEPLRGTKAHGLPQTLNNALAEVIDVCELLDDYRAKLVQDGDAVNGQNVDTYA